MRNFCKTYWIISLLLVAIALLLKYISFIHTTTIPDTFSYKANLFSIDNFYDETQQRFSGEILSVTDFEYKVIEKDKQGNLRIENIFDVKKPSGEQIFSVKRLYCINPKTGAHVNGKGDKSRTGYLFASPNSKDKLAFDYWHINYNVAARMHFEAEAQIAGLKVYKYVAKFTADQTEDLHHLPTVPDLRGIEAEVELILWIDPITRQLIKYEDYTTAWYYDIKTHKRLAPWNKFHNEYTQTSILNLVKSARISQAIQLWIGLYLPLLCIGLAFFIPAFSLLKTKNIDVFLPTIAGMLVFLTIVTLSLLYYNTERSAKAQLKLESIENDAVQTLTYIKNELDKCKVLLDIFQFEHGQFTNGPGRTEFHKLGNYLLQKSPAIKAMAYLPLVPHSYRSIFEQNAKKEGFANFNITEISKNGSLQKSKEKAFYFPIFYIEPYLANQTALGYDVSSDTIRAHTLQTALSTKDMALSPPIQLVQEKDKTRLGFIMYNPVFKNQKLKGYYSGVYDIQSLIIASLNSTDKNKRLKIEIYDIVNEKNKKFFQNFSDSIDRTKMILISKRIPFLNRTFEVKFYAEPASIEFTSVLILLIGGILAVLASIFTYQTLNNKTKALEAYTKDLKHATLVLQHKNTQLIDFCNVVSHNLRAPLTNMSMLIKFIEESKDDAERGIILGKMNLVTNHLSEIFSELIDSIQVQQDIEIASDIVNLELALNKVLIGFEPQIVKHNVVLKYQFSEAPVVCFPRKYLDSTLNNLISNALKYRSPDRILQIELNTKKTGTSVLLSVKDNGLGIDLDLHKNRIFKIRNTFHKHPDAKGFGLFMTKTQIEAMGGEIWVESKPNVGSTFYVQLNSQPKL